MKVVIAPDKFKGSLTSVEVADAIEQGILSVNPKCQTRKLYIADGGDGTMEAIVNSLNGSMVIANVSNPIGRTIEARYGIVNSDTAVIDVATASGLALLSAEERNPLYTTSFGTGELILHAIEKKGIKKFIIGIGGSATNDAATGLLSALGFVFRDSSRNPVTGCGANLEKIQSIDESNVNESIHDCTFTILCDVDAEFYGANGAARLFAAQKGANDETIARLDAGMSHFANIIRNHTGKSVQNQSYSGAAGGIGGSLWALLGARLSPGIYELLKIIQFEDAIRGASLVITGEGAMDRVSLLGKAPYGVCGEAAWCGVPTIAIVGSVADSEMLNEYGFLSVFPIQSGPTDLTSAIDPTTAKANIRRTIAQIFRLLMLKKPD